MLTACMAGRRFALVTFARALGPWFEECVRAHGLWERCAGIRMLDTPVPGDLRGRHREGGSSGRTREARHRRGRGRRPDLGRRAVVGPGRARRRPDSRARHRSGRCRREAGRGAARAAAAKGERGDVSPARRQTDQWPCRSARRPARTSRRLVRWVAGDAKSPVRSSIARPNANRRDSCPGAAMIWTPNGFVDPASRRRQGQHREADQRHDEGDGEIVDRRFELRAVDRMTSPISFVHGKDRRRRHDQKILARQQLAKTAVDRGAPPLGGEIILAPRALRPPRCSRSQSA